MKKLLSIIPVILLFTSYAIAQEKVQAGARFTETAVAIYNNTTNKITFLLGSNTKLDTFTLKEKEVWLSPPFTFNPIFKMTTQNHTVTYQLKLNNAYMIFWNDRKKYWDLEKTQKRQ